MFISRVEGISPDLYPILVLFHHFLLLVWETD
ncbi:unnamed protein product [Urochloa humidicola]